MEADDFLEPIRHSAYHGKLPETLEQTHPTFQGTWVFRDPNSAAAPPRAPYRHPGRPMLPNKTPVKQDSPPTVAASLIVVRIDWMDDEEGKPEKGLPMFYRLEAGKLGPRKNMDINLIELGEYVTFP